MEHFAAHELVCPHVFKVHGDTSFKFADERLLKWLAWFREAVNLPVTVNDYKFGGKHSQRGYRCYFCQIVKDKIKADKLYLSAHTRFQAIDFSVEDMSSEEVRQFIERHKNEMPCNIRIESGTPTWTHVDVSTDSFNKITYF